MMLSSLIRTEFYHTIFELMKKDPKIFFLGEGAKVKMSFDYPDILTTYPDRVITGPIAEAGLVNVALGASLVGMRPIVDLTFNDLAFRAMDEIINHVGKLHYMSGGKLSPRVVIKADFNKPENAQSGNRLASYFLHQPGLKVVIPSDIGDAASFIHKALTGDDPFIYLEDRLMKSASFYDSLPFGKARVIDTGERIKDVTIVTYGCMVEKCLEAAQDFDTHVIDLRTLNPLDMNTIIGCVNKTYNVLVVEADYTNLGLGAEIVARLGESDKIEYFSATRLGVDEILMPANPALQELILPSVDSIKRKIAEIIRGWEA